MQKILTEYENNIKERKILTGEMVIDYVNSLKAYRVFISRMIGSNMDEISKETYDFLVKEKEKCVEAYKKFLFKTGDPKSEFYMNYRLYGYKWKVAGKDLFWSTDQVQPELREICDTEYIMPDISYAYPKEHNHIPGFVALRDSKLLDELKYVEYEEDVE